MSKSQIQKTKIKSTNAWYKNKVVWLVGIVILVYANSLWNDYNIDDVFIVNSQTKSTGFKAISEIFTTHYWQQKENTFGYRPIVRTSYVLEQELWGNNPTMSHALNLIFYAITILLLFRILMKLFPDNEWLIWWVCALFAVHPIHTEVVVSLKNREDLFTLLFGLLAIQFALNYFINKKILSFVLSIFFAALATLSKESGFVFLLLIPLTIVIYFRSQWKILIKSYAFWLLIFLLFFSLWVIIKLPKWILPPEDKIVYFFENPLHELHFFTAKLLLSLETIGFYTYKLILPFPLLFYYGYKTVDIPTGISFFMTLAIVVLISSLFIAWKYRKKNLLFIFGTAWFWISILPFSNYFMPINGIVAERLAYIASAGFVLAFTSLLFMLKNKNSIHRILLVLTIVFSVMSIQRNSQWKNMNTLFEADMPYLENSAKANASYASLLLNNLNQRSKNSQIYLASVDSITKYYKKSVEIYPSYYSSMNNIGLMYMSYYNKDSIALSWFKKSLEIKSNYAEASYNIGRLYLKQKDTTQSLKYLKDAANQDSSNLFILSDLANLYFSLKKIETAYQINKKIEQTDSSSDIPYINYGNYALLTKDTANAVKFWEIVIQKKSNNPSLINGLSHYFIQHGNIQKGQYYQSLFYKLQNESK